jgi:hypothetical protein
LPEKLIVPGIFADGEREALACKGVQALALGGSKITLFVEDVVEGQKPFGLDELDNAVPQQSSRVRDLFTRSGRRRGNAAAENGQRGSGGGRSGNFRHRLAASCHEGWLVKKIRRGITTNCQLRKHDDVRLGRAGLSGKIDDFLCIPPKISYRGVDLGESDLHFSSLPTASFTLNTKPMRASFESEVNHGSSYLPVVFFR